MQIRFSGAWAIALGAGLVTAAPSVGAQTPELYGPVQGGQTLWGIVSELKPRYPNMTRFELLEALYAANPQAFRAETRQLKTNAALVLPAPKNARELANRRDLPASQRSAAPETPSQLANTATGEAAVSVQSQASVAEAPLGTKLDSSGSSAEAAPSSSATSTEVSGPEAGQATSTPRSTTATSSATATTNSDKLASLLAEARRMRDVGNATGAFELLIAELDEFGGNPDFDYQLGASALDAGEYNHAVFALQRVAYLKPNFAAARLELGLAHMALGNNERARTEFERVRAMNPPKSAVTALDRAMVVLAERERVDSKMWEATVRASAGFDTNVNASTTDNSFLGFELDPQNQETDSPFIGAGAGIRAGLPLGYNMDLSGGVTLDHRHHTDASFVDNTLVRAYFEVAKRWDHLYVSLGNAYHYGLLDQSYNNRGAASTLNAGYALESMVFSGQLRSGTLRFNDALESRDVNQLSATLSARWQPAPRLLFGMALSLGEDEAREPGSDYSRDLTALRASLSWQSLPDLRINTALGWLNADYPDPFFGLAREDDQWSLEASVAWDNLLPDGWVFTPNARYIDNDSTVTLFKYDRVVIGFTASRGF